MERSPLPPSQSRSTTPLRQHLASLTQEQLLDLQNSLARNLADASLEKFLEVRLGIPAYPHLKEWCRLAEAEPNLHVQASRDHFKSSFWSFAYPLWRIHKFRREKPSEYLGIALFSYTEDQARFNLKRIRQRIETDPDFAYLMPEAKSSVWDAGNLDCSNGAWLQAYGFGSAFRGRHPHLVIIDDPCKDHGTISIEQQVQFFSSVIIPAAKRGAQIIVTGNPVAPLDFLEWLERQPRFKLYKYPVLNEKDEPLCPAHYDRDAIEEKRSMMPAHLFAHEYLLKRISAADATFRPEMFRKYRREDIAGKQLYKVMTIDPALSPGGDALAAVVVGVDAKDQKYVLDRLRFRGDFKTGLGYLCEMMVRNSPDYIGVEKFAFQKMYGVALNEEIKRRALNFWVNELPTDTKRSKAARIQSLQPFLAHGTVYFLEEHKQLIDQFLLWDPLAKVNDDDEIDAMAWQPALWRPALPDEVEQSTEPAEGTFDEAFQELLAQGNGDYLDKMFGDFRDA